jgi:hypothetical protein
MSSDPDTRGDGPEPVGMLAETDAELDERLLRAEQKVESQVHAEEEEEEEEQDDATLVSVVNPM